MDSIEEQQLQKILENEKKLLDSINKNTTPNFYPLDFLQGFIIDNVPKEILENLQLQIDNMNLNHSNDLPSVHNSLAGNIRNQYALTVENDLENYIFYLCEKYLERFPSYITTIYSSNAVPIEVKLQMNVFSLWVNFMKKHEFNPPHTHSGRFSFVIWHKVPYTNENEIRYGPSKRVDNNNLAGVFQFLYPNFTEQGIGLTNIRADNAYEGKICLFPSYLHHSVFPFYTSDEYRISIAGNVKFVNGE